MAFDLLIDAGTPLTGRPLRDRRRALDRLAPLLEPPLQVTPATPSRDIAAGWLRDYTRAEVGIEGLIIKGLAQPYRPTREPGSSSAPDPPPRPSSELSLEPWLTRAGSSSASPTLPAA